MDKGMSDLTLVKEYRGGWVENVHAGHICGVSDNGELRYVFGNPLHRTYLRSSAKPIQAIPAIMHGVDEHYALTDEEIAILAGSHNGEPFHVRVLESMMAKIGVREEQLVCHPTYPNHGASRDALIVSGQEKRSIYHNCSGKHLGVLSLCLKQGLSTEDYWRIDHPAQQAILRTMSILAEIPMQEIAIGTDGCGLPVMAISLQHLATAYLKLACPDLISDEQVRAAVVKLTGAMNRNGLMISGTGTVCSTLLQDDNIVAKGGAKGVYCFGLREERLAFALKVMDGSSEEWPLILASILEQIDYRRTETIVKLRGLYPADIFNDNKLIVGRNETVFRLKTVG
ncbi:asparaginase [Cohnella panacarvi]|uniref:asparaginase n=1 Tax=Cohnella panacarvi TaxID=400776 RepID=UPI001FDEBAD9|nr:asparaginase [Cohnella panacarvi]